MGTKANVSPNDGYTKALPDEPLFTLLARDKHAPEILRFWSALRGDDIDMRLAPGADQALIAEARSVANEMEVWREQNDGKWRASFPLLDGPKADA